MLVHLIAYEPVIWRGVSCFDLGEKLTTTASGSAYLIPMKLTVTASKDLRSADDAEGWTAHDINQQLRAGCLTAVSFAGQRGKLTTRLWSATDPDILAYRYTLPGELRSGHHRAQ